MACGAALGKAGVEKGHRDHLLQPFRFTDWESRAKATSLSSSSRLKTQETGKNKAQENKGSGKDTFKPIWLIPSNSENYPHYREEQNLKCQVYDPQRPS